MIPRWALKCALVWLVEAVGWPGVFILETRRALETNRRNFCTEGYLGPAV
jgi:hypothetical protein